MATDQATQLVDLPIVCTLQGSDRERRGDEVSELFQEAIQVDELSDGLALSFRGSDVTARRLLDFVLTERQCCAFFTFDLTFTPNQGPIRLQLRGPDGAKDVLKANWLERGQE